MEESQDPLVPLGQVIGKEIARLGRSGEVSAREELRLHVWPFLQDLVEATTYALSAVAEGLAGEPGVPVELIARTMVVLSALLRHGQATLPAPLFAVLSRMATEVTEALTELADPSDLETALATEIESLQGALRSGEAATASGEAANASPAPANPPPETTP